MHFNRQKFILMKIKLYRVLCCRFKGKLHIHTHTSAGKHFEEQTNIKNESARKSCIQLRMQNAMEWKKERKKNKRRSDYCYHWNWFNRFLCWKHFCFVSFFIRWSFFRAVWRLFYCLFNLISIVMWCWAHISVCVFVKLPVYSNVA